MIKYSKVLNFKNYRIFKIQLFGIFFILLFGKSIFYNLIKLLNTLVIQIIYKKWKKSIMKLSNNSSFVILVFAILKFRNIGRSTFRRSKFWLPPIRSSLRWVFFLFFLFLSHILIFHLKFFFLMNIHEVYEYFWKIFLFF